MYTRISALNVNVNILIGNQKFVRLQKINKDITWTTKMEILIRDKNGNIIRDKMCVRLL